MFGEKRKKKSPKELGETKGTLGNKVTENDKTACKENLAEVEKFLLQINERLGEIGQK